MNSPYTIHDVESGLPVSPPMRQHYDVESVQGSPDGSRTLSSGKDDIVNPWDAQTGRRVLSSLLIGGVRNTAHFSLSHDASQVLAHFLPERNERETIQPLAGKLEARTAAADDRGAARF